MLWFVFHQIAFDRGPVNLLFVSDKSTFQRRLRQGIFPVFIQNWRGAISRRFDRHIRPVSHQATLEYRRIVCLALDRRTECSG